MDPSGHEQGEPRYAYGDPRAAAARAWASASRVNAYWRTRPNPFQRIIAALLAIVLIGVLVIGALAAMIVGAAVLLLIYLVAMLQRGLDRIRGIERQPGRGPGGADQSLRKNVRVMTPRE